MNSLSSPAIKLDISDAINHAAWENSIPLIRQLAIDNPSSSDLSDVTLTVTSTPPFLRPKTWKIDRLPAGAQLSLKDLDIHLEPGYLRGLDEATRGELQFELLQSGHCIAEHTHSLRVLAKDEWGGMSSMGALLPAFVTPNDPALSILLKSVASILKEAGYSSALDGYQSKDRKRVYMLAAALWAAISEKKIVYANPPSSFEKSGQKVRRTEVILSELFATCLDSTLLFASGLEALGLNPAIVMMKGHCFVGVWLEDKTFSRLIEPDCSEVRKAISSDELIVFETTLVTNREFVSFDKAINTAKEAVDFDKESEFEAVIDIKRARMANIRPLASHRANEPTVIEEERASPVPALPELPTLQERITPEEIPTTAAGRLERWQRKLLDLSQRNALLNFKATKKSIPILCACISTLEDKLAAGINLKLASLEDSNSERQRNHDLHRQRTQVDIVSEYTRSALERNEVLSSIDGDDLSGRLVTLFRNAKSALAEGGSNTLYLAVGFLRWKQSGNALKTSKAPLLLIPIQLIRRSVSAPFYLTAHEDEPRFNSTLVQLLKRDFGCDLSGLEANLPMDSHGIDVDRLLEMVRTTVRNMPGFEVTKEAAIAQFSFSKFLMWRDLSERLDSISENRVVRHLIHEPDKSFHVDGLGPRPQANEIDRRYTPADLVHPLPADSSQLSAMMAASEGHDLIIIGPPGTGKSQTIANIIAQCLAVGKRVLFVAEKTAALDVVHRRLKERGLGDCCIELHSNKADKAHFVSQLFHSWKNRTKESAQPWLEVNQNLQQKRDQLNRYADAVHHIAPNGWSPFKAMGYCVKASAQSQPKLNWKSSVQHDQAQYQSLENLILQLGKAIAAAPPDLQLDRIATKNWTMAWELQLIDCCEQLKSHLPKLKDSLSEFYELVRQQPFHDLSAAQLQRLLNLCEALSASPPLDNRLFQQKDLINHQALLKNRQELRNQQNSHVTILNKLLNNLSDLIGTETSAPIDSARRKQLLTLANAFKVFESAWEPILLHADFPALLEAIEEFDATQQRRQQSISAMVTRGFNKQFLGSVSIEELIREGEAVAKAGWLTKRSKRNAFDKKLQALMIPGTVPNTELDLNFLRDYQAKTTELRNKLLPIFELPKSLQQMHSHERSKFESVIEQVVHLRKVLVAAGIPALEISSKFQGKLQPFLRNCGAILSKFFEAQKLRDDLEKNAANMQFPAEIQKQTISDPSSLLAQLEKVLEIKQVFVELKWISDLDTPLELKTHCSDLIRIAANCQKRARPVFEQIKNYERLAQVPPIESSTHSFFKDLESQVNVLQQQRHLLKSYLSLKELYARAEGSGVGEFIAQAKENCLTPEELLESFRISYAHWIIPSFIDAAPALRDFQRFEHEECIRQFDTLDDQARSLAAQRSKLAVFHDLPSEEQVAKKSELGMLRHQASLKKPSKSIREMIIGMPESFGKLAPCMLMSPLSIAQYLPANHPPFDVVVFDEASQIATWDAIGAIARGRQTIIVGDPKQLPPTNFFGRSDSDEDEQIEDHERDLESILDEARTSGLPTLQLNWHYRSKHESLIAFSNWNYYGNNLVTFPAAESIDRGVEFHYVPDSLYDRGGTKTNRTEAQAVVQDLVERMRGCLRKAPEERLTYGVVTFNMNQQTLIQDLIDEEVRKDRDLEWFFADERVEPTMVKNLENVQGDERDVMYFSITFARSLRGELTADFGALNRSGGERRLNVAITRARQALHVFASIQPSEIPVSRAKGKGVKDLAAFLEYAERGPKAILDQQESEMVGYDSKFEEAVAEALAQRGWQIEPQVGVSGFRIDLGVVHPKKPGSYLAGVECDGATYHRSAVARDRDKIRQQVLKGLGWNILRIWSTDWWYSPSVALEAIHQELLKLLAESEAEESSPVPNIAASVSEPSPTPTEKLFYLKSKVRCQQSNQIQFFEESYSQNLQDFCNETIQVLGPIREDLLLREIAIAHGFKKVGIRISQRIYEILSTNHSLQEGDRNFFWPDTGVREMIRYRHAEPGQAERSIDELANAELAGYIAELRGELPEEDTIPYIAQSLGIGRVTKENRERIERALETSLNSNVLLETDQLNAPSQAV